MTRLYPNQRDDVVTELLPYMQVLVRIGSNGDKTLLPLFRWIHAPASTRAPFEDVAAQYLPPGVRLVDGGTWWSREEYEEWLATSSRASRRSGTRAVQPTQTASRTKRASTNTDRATTKRQPEAHASSASGRKRKTSRPPNVFDYVDINGLSPADAVKAILEKFPTYVSVLQFLHLPTTNDIRICRLLSQAARDALNVRQMSWTSVRAVM